MQVIIIGNGVAGITAAINLRKLSADINITVISSESDHFYSRTALMYLYMGHMAYKHLKPYEDWYWSENKINLQRGLVTHIDFKQKVLTLQDQSEVSYDKLLLSTGSKPNKIMAPGEDLQGVQGLYDLADLQTLEANSQKVERAVVIGGGLIGIELAEMLYTRCISVTMLVREKHYWGSILPPEEATIIENHIREHGVDLRLNTVIQEFVGDTNSRLQNVITASGEKIDCQIAGVGIGVRPNVDFLKNTDLEVKRGIVVNEFLETNIPDVYAAGDCAEIKLNTTPAPTVEQLWYTGRMQGETVAHNIAGKRIAYDRGIWFNSAKFFDIEYQTYGRVPNHTPEGVSTFYWQHPKEKKCLRINYATDSQEALGFNLLGIRYRHEVCERWIKEKKTISYVMQHLKEANFDPEFYRKHEKAILKSFTEQKEGNFVLN